MFLKTLVSVDYEAILSTIIVLLLIMVFLYVIYAITSFVFMKIFKDKIKKGKESINVILFQKYDSLMKFVSLYESKLSQNSALIIFYNNEELRKFNELKPEEFEEFYNYSESILNEARKVFINIEDDSISSYAKEILCAIEELNNKFLEATQLYNTNVIGFNYWRDLFATKWLKNILFIKRINQIK